MSFNDQKCSQYCMDQKEKWVICKALVVNDRRNLSTTIDSMKTILMLLVHYYLYFNDWMIYSYSPANETRQINFLNIEIHTFYLIGECSPAWDAHSAARSVVECSVDVEILQCLTVFATPGPEYWSDTAKNVVRTLRLWISMGILGHIFLLA